eukprot:jgi/Bigna1/142794/aug1.73_g17502
MSDIFEAARNNDLARLKSFKLSKKADVEAKDNDGDTPLILGCCNGHLEIVKYLVDMKANIEAKDNDGDTAVSWAIKEKHNDIVDFLRNDEEIQKIREEAEKNARQEAEEVERRRKEAEKKAMQEAEEMERRRKEAEEKSRQKLQQDLKDALKKMESSLGIQLASYAEKFTSYLRCEKQALQVVSKLSELSRLNKTVVELVQENRNLSSQWTMDVEKVYKILAAPNKSLASQIKNLKVAKDSETKKNCKKEISRLIKERATIYFENNKKASASLVALDKSIADLKALKEEDAKMERSLATVHGSVMAVVHGIEKICSYPSSDSKNVSSITDQQKLVECSFESSKKAWSDFWNARNQEQNLYQEITWWLEGKGYPTLLQCRPAAERVAEKRKVFFRAIESLGREMNSFLGAISRKANEIRAKVSFTLKEFQNSCISGLRSLRDSKNQIQCLQQHIANFRKAEEGSKRYKDSIRLFRKKIKELKAKIDDLEEDSDYSDEDIDDKQKELKGKLKKMQKSPELLRARSQLLKMSKYLPELLHKHPYINPLNETAASGIEIRSKLLYEGLKPLRGNHSKRNLYEAVIPAASATEDDVAIEEAKVAEPESELRSIVKKLLANDKSQMEVIRVCKAQGHSNTQIIKILQQERWGHNRSEIREKKGPKRGASSQIQVVLKQFHTSGEKLKQLRRSCHVMASMNHHNIVPLTGICKDEDSWYIQIPLYKSDFESWIKREHKAVLDSKHGPNRGNGKTPMEVYHQKCIKMLKGVLEGLQFLHHAGVVHRDLKPANILIGPPVSSCNNSEEKKMSVEDSEYAVIADFDTCKVEKNDEFSLGNTTTKVYGTHGFIDPQVLAGKLPPSPSSDMYSFAITMGYALSGRMLLTVKDVEKTRSEKLITPDQAQILVALLKPIRASSRSCSPHNDTRRPSAAQILTHKVFSDAGVEPTRTCSSTFTRHNLSEGIMCSNTNGLPHFTCHEAFNHFVRAFSNDSETYKLVERNGFVGCPLSYGKDKKCNSQPFTDLEVALHTTPEVFQTYVNTKKKLAEMKLTKKLEKNYKDELSAELEKFKKLDKKEREVYQARLHIETHILLSFGGDKTKSVDHPDYWGVEALDSCPRCKVGFMGFTGCFALKCDNCGCGFCAWDLVDCGEDAHEHVIECANNKNSGGYYGTKEQYRAAKHGRITRKLRSFLNSRSSIAHEVVAECKVGLRKLGFEHILREYSGNGQSLNNDTRYDGEIGLALLQEEADGIL